MFISIFGSSIGVAMTYKPKTVSVRVLYIFGAFSSIIFVTSFLSVTIELLNKTVLENQIDSIQNIVGSERAFELTGDQFALEQLLKQNEVSF